MAFQSIIIYFNAMKFYFSVELAHEICILIS